MEENLNYFNLTGLLNRPAVVEILVDILLCAVPIWLAIMIGLVIGWSWRPRWTGILYLGLRSKLRFAWTAAVPPGFGLRRLCLAFSALSAFSVGRTVWVRFSGRGKDLVGARPTAASRGGDGEPGTSEIGDVVTEKDLEHLLHLIESKDGEAGWQSMMEHSTSNMTYQAWRHDPENLTIMRDDPVWGKESERVRSSVLTFKFARLGGYISTYRMPYVFIFAGPVVYCSRTVFEDATPDLVRDFFWDDEFRPKWDPMLAYFRVLEEHPHTGTTVVHWIKKFPFFCSDREYIIGRRIWEDGKTFYCVTKGVPYPALQRRDKPRRVDLYFSSWIIKPVQSRRGDGRLSACEVTLVHYEDMGIPKDVAKLGVRHGMWGTVKKLHSGFRSYQQVRKSEAPLSRSALMARITTRISSEEEDTVPLEIASSEEEREDLVDIETTQKHGGIDWKWVVLGGTVALVFELRTGFIRKALFLGAQQRVLRR